MFSHVNQASLPADKIALFRSLFRGREDVYPRRFESRKTGKSGYQPACANEWARGLCDKRAVRCIKCPNRRFFPVTDETINEHLRGQDKGGQPFVMGVYPMFLDESCFFLAADFDKASWRDDVAAVRETCGLLGVPAALERSRSGNGAHLWFFFEEAIPAVLARKFGAHILTETMERRPDVGLDSYDRFFPNQDTLPDGGFGNLIALPLQRAAREQGHSMFIDDQLIPFTDQWEYLANVPRMKRETIENLVGTAERQDRIVGVRFVLNDEGDEAPWTMPPSRCRKDPPITVSLPKSLDLVLGNQIYIAKESLPPVLRNRLIRLAAFQNPEFYKLQAMRRPAYSQPRIIACAEDCPRHIGLPRGCLEETRKLLASLNIKAVVQDERCAGVPLDLAFQGELYPDQRGAAEDLLAYDTGILSATTAFGKTVLAAWLIAQRGVNTLILVHRRQLMAQWVERLSEFLGIPKKEIGQFGGGRKKPTGRIDVAVMQSLVHDGVVNDMVGEYGHLIVDECHHLSAPNYGEVARQAKARYVTGLTATLTRKDGHHPIVPMLCGPVRHRVSAKHQAEIRPFRHSVLVRPTSFRALDAEDEDKRLQFHALYEALIADGQRNRLICQDVMTAVQDGRSPVVLTQRTEHLETLQAMLTPVVQHLVVLRGGMGRKELKGILEQLATIPETESRVLLATGHYIGEGFDDARLDTLFLTLPVSWRGTIAQYAGRLHRLHERKKEVRIYDYADLNVPMLSRMFDKRCSGYEAIGYSILLPASAVPGWPPEVPLPIEPEWKRDYAASVQRLIRDGVDSHLGNLFVHAARSFTADAQGVERARSASEAFLFKRLETLSETSGRYTLNVKLPIPFSGSGHMEVDFIDSELRLVIELDGPQHFCDLEAYRRDRLKDALLQENGYFILRFLAEDIGKLLDHVLDTILRTQEHRRKCGSKISSQAL